MNSPGSPRSPGGYSGLFSVHNCISGVHDDANMEKDHNYGGNLTGAAAASERAMQLQETLKM